MFWRAIAREENSGQDAPLSFFHSNGDAPLPRPAILRLTVKAIVDKDII